MNVKQYDSGRLGLRVPVFLLLLVLGVGTLLILEALSRSDGRVKRSTSFSRQDSIALVSTVYAFSAFASEHHTKALTRGEASEGLRLLAAVLYTFAKRELAVPPSRYAIAGEQLMEAAYVIERNLRVAAHTRIVRSALNGTADALAETPAAGEPRLSPRLRDLRAAAEAIQADQPFATQRGQIRDCFDRANAFLQTLVGVTFAG
jgi:hypothetical protein